MLQQASTTDRTVARDLAVSAVASDTAFVRELIDSVADRLQMSASPRIEDDASAPIDAVVPWAPASPVVLVLHHHLWLHDEAAQRDAQLLRDRVEERATSVCVLMLDSTPIAPWLRAAPRYDVLRSGHDGAADFLLDALARGGASVTALPAKAPAPEPAMRWSDTPAPFLSQQRAHSTLRHELDALAEALEAIVDEYKTAQPDRPFDLQVTPQRLVARLDDVAVSFSWLTGRSASVSDGSLLVIAWRGVIAGMRGFAALRSATVIHERSYAADGNAPSSWRWRSADPVAHPYSSTDLVAAWMARASIARAG
jgi:hypothetical protein